MANINAASALKDVILEAGNKKPVSEFVNYIRDNLAVSTKSWKLIAAAFHEASEMYGFDSDSYKRLLQETGFHKSKASKFIAIASSERLKKYETQLHCVHSWNTLYEITTLSEVQFDSLCMQYNLDNADACPFLTEAQVAAFKRVEAPKSPYKRLAYITIDEDALKGQLVDGCTLESLHNSLNALKELSPYIRVEETGIDDAEGSIFMEQVMSTMRALATKKLKEVYERKLKSISLPKRKGQTADQRFVQAWGISREELFGYIAEGEPDKAFGLLDVIDECNENKLWDAALEQVQRSRVKFMERARARANTAEPHLARVNRN
jgi:hypothetical protein